MSWDVTVEPAGLVKEPFDMNLTYNVGKMLRRAGVHPRLMNDLTALSALSVAENAYELMADNQDYFRQFEPENKWGTAKGCTEFLRQLRDYLRDCPPGYVVRWR